MREGMEVLTIFKQHQERAKIAIEKIIEQGKKEGMPDKQIGELIRAEMKRRGLSNTTIRKHLPLEYKNQNMIRKRNIQKKEPLVTNWDVELDLEKFRSALQTVMNSGKKKAYVTHDNKRVVDVGVYE